MAAALACVAPRECERGADRGLADAALAGDEHRARLQAERQGCLVDAGASGHCPITLPERR
jgi:hypothetical protein